MQSTTGRTLIEGIPLDTLTRSHETPQHGRLSAWAMRSRRRLNRLLSAPLVPRLPMFMRFQLCRAAVGLSTVLMAPKVARAVDPKQPATSYIRTTFTVEDGLSSNVVNAIVQTRDGFLVIGTDA